MANKVIGGCLIGISIMGILGGVTSTLWCAGAIAWGVYLINSE